jgi:hypothetical protein
MTEAPLKMTEVMRMLDKGISTLINDVEATDKTNIKELLKSFQKLRDVKERLDEHAELIDKMYSQYSYKVIPDAMEAEGFDSIKANGKNYIVAVRTNASIPEHKRTAGFAWLQQHAGAELIVSTVNPRTLTSFIKTYIEETGMQPPEEAVTLHMQKYMSVRKA